MIERVQKPGLALPAIDARKIFTWHCVVIAGFVVAHGLVVMMGHLGHHRLLGMSDRLNMTEELSLPTFFSALALAACALVAALLSRNAAIARERRGWTILAVGFLFLAFDEACTIHELFDEFVTHLDGPFLYAWVIPYGLATLVAVGVLFPFWWRLPSAPRVGLAVGASIFVGSALGMELVESTIVSAAGDEIYDTSRMMLFLVIEEGGEMIGVAVLLRSLLAYLTAGAAPGNGVDAGSPSGFSVGRADRRPLKEPSRPGH